MKNGKRLFTVVASGFLVLCMTIAPMAAGFTNVTAFANTDLGEVGLEKIPDPIDPQSWRLNRDMTWDDYNPNPAIDWKADLNKNSLNNKFAYDGNPNKPIKGGLLLFEYLDRKFISRQPVGTDPLGFYMFNKDGSGMQDEKTNNPVLDVYKLLATEKGYANREAFVAAHTTEELDKMFAQWWADFLNKPQELNNFSGISEFWRENSYGKWDTDIIPFGPFTIDYFEFETMQYDQNSSFQTYRDVPPSFRRGSTGTSNGFSFDSIAHGIADQKGIFDNLDFFFLLHAGYDESGVWQEFGKAQFATREEIPYELGPGPRMAQVEKFFTENPSYLEMYKDRYAGTPSAAFWAGELEKYKQAPDSYVFKLQQADWDWVAGYGQQTQRNTRYVSFTSWEAAVGEWSHAGSYTIANGGSQNGRTLPRSTQGENDGMATFAHEFGHLSSISDNYGSPWVDQFSPATEPWDVMSRGSFAGPFGDHARWTVPGVEAGSVPTNLMQWNKDALLNFYNDGDQLEVNVWDLAAGTPVVTDIVARNIPLADANYPDLANYGLTQATKGGNYYKSLRVNLGTDRVSNNRFGKLPVNGMTAWKDKGVYAGTQQTSGSSSVTVNGVRHNSNEGNFIVDGVTYLNPVITGTNSGFTNALREAAGYMVEVVDQNGYDSFLNDHGVLLSRFHVNQSNPSHAVVDSHLGDIAMIDYEMDGDNYPYPMAHATQLADAAFHAGVSTTDTGYYASIYDPSDPNYANPKAIHFNTSTYAMEWKKNTIEPGSIQQWEPRGNRDIVSGNTVNEWEDTANKLHFYILQKNTNDAKYGKFMSYQVGVLHKDGKPVGGELVVEKGELQPATAGRVAVQEFKITNKGANATDIVRVEIGGTLGYKTTILNNLFAIAPDETITVPVYIEVPAAVGFAAASVPSVTLTSLSDEDLTLTASSESNKAKTSTATVGDAANQSTVNKLIVTTDKAIVSTNEYFNVNVKFAEKVSSNTAILTYTFDTDKFEYRGLGLAPGVKALNTVVNGGTLKITVMVDDYDTLDYGNVLFSANGNIDLTNKANEILVKVQCVEKDANGVKTIKGADGGTVQLTGLQGDTNGDGKVDLIDLSNMIDWYGFNTNTPDWETKYVFYDFNRTGEIDISDVTKVAQLINL